MNDVIVINEETYLGDDEEAQLEEVIQNLNMVEEDAESLRSLTRLLIGGTLVGWDELLAHLKSWEAQVATERQRRELTRTIASEPEPVPAMESMRYTLIGLFFEAQDRWLRRGRKVMNIADRTTEAFLSPLVDKLDNDPRLRPARSRFETLVNRGETTASRWVERGRIEEERSRKLVRVAVQEGFNSSMDQLGQAPALQDLVRKQSVGLTQEVVDEVRARTVTADMLAETVARSVLRRAPRSELPPPPTATPDVE